MSVKLRCAAAIVALVIGTAGVSGCSANPDSAVCEVLTSDMEIAATVFTSVIPVMNTADQVERRIALMDRVESPPVDLVNEWTAWHSYLERAAKSLTNNPTGMVESSPAERDAGKALASFYTGTCMD